MAPADDAAAAARELADDVREFLDTVHHAIAVAGAVEPAIVTATAQGVQELNEAWAALWAKVEQLLAHRGDSEQLRSTAEQWSSVGALVSTTAATVTLDQMATPIEWEGSAADAYRISVPPQSDALGQIKTASVSTSNSLHSMADAIDNFWLAVKVALVSAGVAVVGAIAGALTIVGVPAAIALAAGGLGIALTALGVGLTQGVLVVQRSDEVGPQHRTHRLRWTRSAREDVVRARTSPAGVPAARCRSCPQTRAVDRRHRHEPQDFRVLSAELDGSGRR